MARHDSLADLNASATPGAEIIVRVTPRASRNSVVVEGGKVRVYVTAAPSDGQANDAVRRLLAGALGIAPSRLTLARGASGRDKTFRIG